MSPRTIFLSRLIGVFALMFSIAEMMHKAAMVATVTELMTAPPLLLLFGMLSLLGGLAVVLTHNVWKSGVAPMLISLVGWVLVLKGMILIFVSSSGVTNLFSTVHFTQYYYGYALIALVLGLYLSFIGFTAKPKK